MYVAAAGVLDDDDVAAAGAAGVADAESVR